MPRSTADRTAVALCLAAAAYCIAGASFKLHRISIDIAAVSRADPAEPELSGGASFGRNNLYTYTVVPPFTGAVKLYGSWAKPVPSAGSTHSAWYKPAPHFAIFFAGYPNHARNHLFVEVETAKAGIIRLPLSPELLPGEAWWLKNFALPEDQQPLRFRIAAMAVPSDSQGWLGFSEPFVIRSVDNLEVSKQLLLIFLAAAGAAIAFLSPGLMLRQRRRRLHFIWIPFPGMLLLALFGLIVWLTPVAPRLICRIGLFSLIGFAAYHSIRFPLSAYTSRIERQALLVFLLLVLIGTAKSTYSLGPIGELYAGRISRTLEVGARSDSRTSYHIIQLVRFRESPGGAYSKGLFGPWTFSHRGPIAALAVTPLVLFGRLNITRRMPDQPWTLYDLEGFAVYRIGMVVLACCGLLAVFGLARVFLPGDWAFFAFLVAVTAPFTVHEIYFTWPKLPEAGCVLLAAYLAFRRRYLFAGLAAGLAYLVHPSALLSVPALIGIIILQKRAARIWPMLAGLGACLVLWRLVNYGHYAQDTFLSYFKLTGGLNPPTIANWFRSRIASVLNTLVPLNLILFHRWNVELQSIYAFSPPVVQFFFSYWNTLPFGAGIAFFFVGLLRLLYVACRKARRWLVALFVIPFALFVPYWGWGRSGLLPEGLHAWFLGLMIFAVIIWHRLLRRSDLFFLVCNWALLFRGVETLCVLVVPTLVSQHVLVQPPFVLSDAIALITMAAATLWLYLYVFRWAERLRAFQRYSKHQESTGLFQRPNRSSLAGTGI